MSTAGERNKEVYEKIKAALPPELHDTLDEFCEEFESDFTEAKEKHDEELSDATYLQDDMERALETVKYWMHDVYVCGKPMSDPRKILRIVEDAL